MPNTPIRPCARTCRRPAAAVAVAGALLLTLFVAGCGGPDDDTTGAGPPPDLVVHGGTVLTVDANFSIVEAFAVRDGRIVATGSSDRMLALAGADTRRVDLAGATVMPGFNDTHSHVVQLGVNLPATMDLTRVTSIDDIAEVVAARAARAEPGEWLFSEGGWWEFMLEGGRLPDRHDLDPVSPDNPVLLRGGHYFIANSRALEVLGYDRDTPDPPGGEIWRDDDGEPTGFLLRAAGTPALEYFPELDRDTQLDGIREAMHRVNSWGMTSLREAGGPPEHRELLRTLYERGDMTVRIDWAYDIDPNTPEDELDALFESLGPPGETWGDGMFRADGLAELFLDGAEESGQLREPYEGRPDYYGLRLVEQDQLNAFMLAAARHGWRPGPHAVGDAAIDQALEAFAHVNARIPITDRRWMIDHAILLQPDQHGAVRELGLIVNAQPRHLYIIADKFAEFWGEARAEQAYSLRDWLDAGLTVALGADRPVSPRSTPLMQIYVAVSRRTGWGDVVGADQAITRKEALRAITATSAYTSFEEDVKGTIEPGRYADFVVLGDNPMDVDVDDIPGIEIRATVLGGDVVYGELR